MEQDIFADVGKYVPVGFLETTDTDKINTDKQNTDKTSKPEITSAKGIFSNLLPSFPSSITVSAPVADNAACSFDDDDDENEGQEVKRIKVKKEEEGERRAISGDDNELMAPIRALLSAQAAKEKAATVRAEEAATMGRDAAHKKSKKDSNFDSLAMGADGVSKVHRDVFGGIDKGVGMGGRRGDAMDHGSYDDYGGENEAYGSDEDDDKEEKGKDKLPLGVSAGGGKDRDKGEEDEGNKKARKGRRENESGDKTNEDYRRERKDKKGSGDGDSSGKWKDREHKDREGGSKDGQSAVRPKDSQNNRAARRAGK